MPIMKRRLDICGREKNWEYTIESAGRQFLVSARQIARNDPDFVCTCGASTHDDPDAEEEDVFSQEFHAPHAAPCCHIAEVQRDLSIARQAAAQMVL